VLKKVERACFALWILALLFLGASASASAGASSRESYEANQKGVEYMERGRLKEAVQSFEKALRADPANKIIKENLSVAYNNFSVELMEDKRYLEAREYLEKAARLSPGDKSISDNLAMVRRELGGINSPGVKPVESRSFESDKAMGDVANDFLMQGIQYYDKKEYALAKDVLHESIKFSETNPTAYEILGDIAYFEQDLKKAKEYYTRAFRLRRSKTLEEKLEKLSREAQVENKLDPYADEHFIIRYKQEESKQIGSGFEIREYLRQAWRAVSQEFGYYPDQKVVVLLYSEDEYRELSETPAWTAGHFDGKIRLPAYRDKTNVRELNKVVWHELTHFFVRDLSRGQCPSWLNEGLAQHEENKVKKIDLALFREVVRSGSLLSMDALETGLSDSAGGEEAALFYQQSFVFTQNLISRYRMFKIKQLLGAYGKGKTTEEAFKQVFGVSARVFDAKWRKSLAG